MIVRRDHRLARQLPDAAGELARLVGSGMTLHDALGEMASAYEPPIDAEFVSVVEDIRYGSSLNEALRAWTERSNRDDVRLLASACRLGVAQGGDLVAALEGVSQALIDSLEVREEARALTAQARTSAVVLMILPLLGLSLFTLLDRTVAAFMFGTVAGLALLGVGLCLDIAGALVMALLLRWALR